MYRKALFITLVVALVAGCPKKKDEGGFGPSTIAVGDDGLIMTSGDMKSWTQVLPATSTITANYDLDKVVKVPARNRVVAIANSDSAIDDTNAEIWYNDNGGTGAWTKAWFGTSATDFSYLDARHLANAADGDWDLTDMFFVDTNTGYAVGTNYIILWTADGGATWKDLNLYQTALAAATAGYMYIYTTNTLTAETIPGASFTTSGGATGTIISIEPSYYIYASVSQPVADTETLTVTGGTAQDIWSVSDALWRYQTGTANTVYAVAAATGEHTIFLGANPGIWKIVSNAPATAAARTFPTVTGPTEAQQTDLDYVYGLFFFNATTGVAGTYDGVWRTTDGLVWTQWASSDTDDFYGFAYSKSDLNSNGYLYGINGYTNDPGRVAVTYAAGVWTFDATNGWVESDGARVDMWYVDGAPSIFLNGDKMFVMDSSNSGEYGWCSNVNQTVLNDQYWQDTTEQYLGGGAAADGTNEAYDKGVLDGTGAPAGTIRSMAKR